MAKGTKPQPTTGALVKVGPAPVVRARADQDDRVPVPEVVRGRAIREAPGLSPTVDWGNAAVGQYVIGHYLGSRDEVGPNKSYLYLLADMRTGEEIGVWGGTVLDRKMLSLNPAKGDVVLVQYIGNLDAKPGQNPARNFRVAIVPEAQAK